MSRAVGRLVDCFSFELIILVLADYLVETVMVAVFTGMPCCPVCQVFIRDLSRTSIVSISRGGQLHTPCATEDMTWLDSVPTCWEHECLAGRSRRAH